MGNTVAFAWLLLFGTGTVRAIPVPSEGIRKQSVLKGVTGGGVSPPSTANIPALRFVTLCCPS